MQNEKCKIRKKLTRKEMVEAVKRFARRNKGAISRDEFVSQSGLTKKMIYQLFPEGGWLQLQKLAGVPRNPNYHRRVSREELMAELHKVALSYGDVPTWIVLTSRSKHSEFAFRKYFGCMADMLTQYVEWLQKNHPGSALIEKVRAKLRTETRYYSLRRENQRTEVRGFRHKRLDGAEYGRAIDFRGLRYAPTNERGVVLLFGMVCREMGFLVEAVQQGFPDCEAKRYFSYSKGEERWKSVRIEFEYRSSGFREHNHDPNGCDIIVCWEHDWRDCPLEVVELRRVIEGLPHS